MSISRRRALQALAGAGAAAASAALPKRLGASKRRPPAPNAVAVLYDPTLCVGCRECILGCAEANGCPDPDGAAGTDSILTPDILTVLERYEPDGEEVFRKAQCMHCVDPACASACMLGAMHRNDDGSVTWNGDLCVGCRYCQIACPFNVPRFEWDTPAPRLRKCELCPERRAEGLEPACVEKCRRGALLFGAREAMLDEAHRRIDEEPARYGPRVYGEHDGGGTSVLYLAPAGVSFASMGLPELGETSVPSLPETIQHTLYKGFVAPLALFAVFGAVVRRNAKKLHEVEAADPEHANEKSEPVGGKLLTWPSVVLAVLAAIGFGVVVWRFVAGLGATTNLNDGYAMGLWIAFDVVTGTALACGGYAVALLVYLANRGKYHPLVRAAIVTSALGYTLGGVSVLIDIGRAWNFYKIPLFFWEWNLNSILLEVALCIMLYTTVLWIEVSPAILEGWRENGNGLLKRVAVTVSPWLERAMPYMIALGLLLPTMHQSSLGSLMLLAGQKLHPLWHTPLLPALFLISCVGMGYAVVTLEANISSRVFRRPSETPMLRALAGPMAVVLLFYAVVRAADVVWQGKLGLVTRMDAYSALFLVEMALFVLPALVLLARRRVAGARLLSVLGAAVILGGALYRFSTYLIAFDPGPQWSYFPALPEFAVTIGLVAAEILGYVILVKRFPVLRGVAPGSDGEGDGAQKSGDTARRARRFRPATAGAAGLAVLLLAVTPVGLEAQSRVQESRHRPPGEDLKCLTARPDQCLDEPVPVDEPHEALCSTCHDLWEQQETSEAWTSCTASACHAAPETLSPFHESLRSWVLEDCASCHRPHDARIPGGAENCSACHASGGEPPDFVGEDAHTAFPVAAPGGDVIFRHSTHAGADCTRCHATGASHGASTVTPIGGCRSCHHTPPVSSDCLQCHADAPERLAPVPVSRTLEIFLGSLDAPERTLPFDHRVHEGESCGTCHTAGGSLSAVTTDCASCHVEHHRPDATCTSCHAEPKEGAHDVDAHLGCGGAGCHENAPESIRAAPRTRDLCLSCHQGFTYHRPDRDCATCHRMPEPRVGGG